MIERQPNKFVICGGRHYANRTYLRRFLDHVHDTIGISCVVHGDAGGVNTQTGELYGADKLAGEWAEMNGIPIKVYPANWDKYGKRAGFLRNYQMLECENPDAIIAFPGNEGTKNMCELALANGKSIIDAERKTIIEAETRRKPPKSTLPGMEPTE